MLTRRLGVKLLLGRDSSSGSIASLLAIGVISWTCRPEALLVRGRVLEVLLVDTGEDDGGSFRLGAALALEFGTPEGDDL